ncbi:hypothetical protein [Streptomyces sp. ITFR-16]|uniref:hypothetical protein n=1 Tax=Streptomyces sp. ITFR-16 TaxID=3075198 RepID=UPI00288BFFA3|nr:hypothetical protein [Streptomyces sp. ITFR-16]WNI24057.1 hypothetical protein RLT58_20010 [Streptomyces sp. ITFR-16]
MIGTAGPAGNSRLGRLTGAVVLLVPLLVAVSGSAPGGVTRAAAAPADAGTPLADTGRIAYAGTEHRSLGRVTGPQQSDPLFGAGPAHFDTDPSARGDRLVFTSLRDEAQPQVYLREADGSVRKLTTGRDASHPELSPDGRTVVFDSAEPGIAGAGKQRDLWAVGTDGTGLRRLTDTPANEECATFSPDGGRIAYSGDADPAGRWRIYTRPLDGGPATALTDPAAGDATEPSWNPVDDDAHRALIAYTLQADAETGPRLRVTDGAGRDEPFLNGGAAGWRTSAASWLPGGDAILFLSPDLPCGCTTFDNVYRAPYNSQDQPQDVLAEDRSVTDPVWLGGPDTGSVVVARTSAPARHLATLQDVRPDGSDPRDLGLSILKEDPAADSYTDPSADPLFNPGEGFDPWTERQNYTPDGRRIVVTRFEDTDAGRIERIWLVDADGSNAAAMPLAGRGERDWDTDPTFSPDGTRLAFTRTSPGGVGQASGPGRILIADAATGAIVDEIRPPAGQAAGGDAQPTWSSDGTTIAFTRNLTIDGNGGNKHVWTASVDDLTRQQDLSATLCPAGCQVIDDSPAFSPDGRTVAFNRKDGGGRVNERSGVLLASLTDGGCQVVLPTGLRQDPGACGRELPDTSASGPFQPRDVAWSPDGSHLVLSSRRELPANSREKLNTLDLSTGVLTPITKRLPGRQKEPAYQQSVDLSVTAPPTAPPLTVGTTTPLTVTVTNRGPSPSPGTTFTVAAPPGVRVDRMTTPAGSCGDASPTCDLGVLAPGASIEVTAELTGVTTGDQEIGWSVSGAVVDPTPTDNAAVTVVPVQDAPAPPTPDPTPTPTPTVTSVPKPPPPAPAPPAPAPAPEAGPALRIVAQPSPGYVGGRVVVTYTVRNGRNALATGLRLRLGLPAAIPADPLPAGCSAGVCALGDLAPGATSVVRVVLRPDKALRTTIDGKLTTTGTDADPKDNAVRVPLRILQPKIIAVPAVGKPGFVTSVRGKDFPPGAPVTLTWKPGITATAPPAVAGSARTFIAQLLILVKDQTGPRTITAKGPGFSPVTTPFLVVTGSIGPPDEVGRR